MYTRQVEDLRSITSPVGQAIAGVDVSPYFVVQYVPSQGTGGAAATIALVQDGDMTFLVDAAAPAGADAIGTAGVIDTSAAAFDTVGELVAAINATQAWRAYATVPYATGMESALAKSAASAFGDNGLTFFSDTSAELDIGVVISGDKFVNNGLNGFVTDVKDQCINELMYGGFQLGNAGAGAITLTIIQETQGANDGQTLYSVVLAEDTLKLLGEASLEVPFVSGGPGKMLTVRAVIAGGAADAYTKFEVVGQTLVLTGSRIVTEKNY